MRPYGSTITCPFLRAGADPPGARNGGAPCEEEAEARDTLTQALEIFEGLGAASWADKARAELARIGGRAPSSLDLTPTEDKVAALVAAGSTNREVADALFVSVHTVEANLKRIYRKLGIRSRTELASKFPPAPSGS